MIKRFAGSALVVAGCLISAAHAEDAATAAPATNDAAAGSNVAVNPDHPTTYTVKPGDTLWGISEKFLLNPWQWPEVWHINEQVGNPHMIYPGDVLRLVWENGKPSLVVDRQVAASGIGSTAVERIVMPDGSVKLRPRMREAPYASAIPAIPLKNIESFLNDSRVVTPEEMKAAPYIVAGTDKRVIMGRGDVVYARQPPGNIWDDSFPEYGAFRQGDPYVDPDTKEVLGYEAKKVGALRLLSTERDIATTRVLASNEDLRVGDRLLGTDQRRVQSVFYPRPAPEGLEGHIVSVFGAVAYGARNNVVVIDRGAREFIEPGHVFSVEQRGEDVRDRARGDIVSLPSVSAGLIIVFRVFEKVSYGLVTRSTLPMGKGDRVTSPRIDAQ